MSSHTDPSSSDNLSDKASLYVHYQDHSGLETNSSENIPQASTGRSTPAYFDFQTMIASLRELFERDRYIASQADTTRCGICYLYFSVSELYYRDDGFYVCGSCTHLLGKQIVPMLRRQQKL